MRYSSIPLLIVLLFCSIFSLGAVFAADPPGILNHQGRIAVDGVNFDGNGQFKFALVNSDGTTSFWSNDDSSTSGGEPNDAVPVTIDKGHYSVLLGDAPMVAIPATVFADNPDIRLRIWFSADNGNTFEQLTPDRRIASVGYALNTGSDPAPVDTNSLYLGSDQDGNEENSILQLGTDTNPIITILENGNVGFGTVGPASALDIHGQGIPVSVNSLNGNRNKIRFSDNGIVRGYIGAGAISSFAVSNAIGQQQMAVMEKTGWVGINVANPVSALEVDGVITASGFSGPMSGTHLTTGTVPASALESGVVPSFLSAGNNHFFAPESGNENASGSANTGLGLRSLSAVVSGSNNTAIGFNALRDTVDSTSNTAIGTSTLQENLSGSSNTAVGYRSMQSNLSGINNTAVGTDSLQANQVGRGNTALGRRSLVNTTGSNNIAIGTDAGSLLTSGDANITIGHPGMVDESATIRIGGSDQNRAFLAGDVTTAGAIIPGGNIGAAAAGMIRWTGTDFEGYDGTKWVSLTVPAEVPESTPFMEFVTVGNKGNGTDPDVDDAPNRFGAVAYQYQIGKYEVTNTQYVAFLNAVAATDPKLLGVGPGSGLRGGIVRSGTSGSYSYAVKLNMGDKPVSGVSFWNACRFCNWLHNGRPGGAQNASTTEDGAYDLTELIGGGNTVTRNTGAKFFIPDFDEWYKAAYHQPHAQGGDSDDYWRYPTQSNDVPTRATADATGNISNSWLAGNLANYGSGAVWDSNNDGTPENGNVTTVGSGGEGSASHYGAFDMGGNVWEWTETISGEGRIMMGGAWGNSESSLRAGIHFTPPPVDSGYADGRHGFRVASP